MQVTLTFSLPDESEALKSAQNGASYKKALLSFLKKLKKIREDRILTDETSTLFSKIEYDFITATKELDIVD
jgi:hypothetical protein